MFRMFYIVGLGNKGEEYVGTRHNVGWFVLGNFIKSHNLPNLVTSAKYSGRVSDGVVGETEVQILFPDTYMNQSGVAVKKLLKPTDAKQLVVVYDDIDLPLGEVKIAFSRGDGGHNGIKSVIAELGTKDFVRVRVGIAPRGFFGGVVRPKGDKLTRYVLGKFTKREEKMLVDVATEVDRVIVTILQHGYEKAMNEFN